LGERIVRPVRFGKTMTLQGGGRAPQAVDALGSIFAEGFLRRRAFGM
jgi:hypothetical protein